MKIIKADYGGVDCTSILQSKVRSNSLIVHSNNSIVGDPTPGIVKYLNVQVELDGKIINQTVKEGGLLTIPKTTKDRIGVFYSNNHNPAIYPAIRASLHSIQTASEGKADIYTCMWKHEPENPFIEYIAWTQTSSHLNQLLQIMQLLYSARQVNPDYKYVSFLEHDVLYPEGYFDYPEFNNGEVYTNMNYMGMNKKGYQPLGQRDEPFHQMTMKFDDAIRHCERILPNALITNSGMIETQTMTRKKWNAVNPSIHINHGYHFTSHYNVYKKTGIFKEHSYWGNHDKWTYLFT
jgi:hypothetical protein